MPCRYRRVAPYLFTPEQIDALIQAAAALTHPLRALNYTTLIALLAVTGMRVGEACGLDRSDVDTGTGVVDHQGRRSSARPARCRCTPPPARPCWPTPGRRDQLCPGGADAGVLRQRRGNRLASRRVPEIFAQLCRAAGISAVPGGRNPRVHDLRHSFTVATMLDWYRAGLDVHARLPLLSTYLGHVDPVSTYWYLQAAPELLALAASRLEDHLGDLP